MKSQPLIYIHIGTFKTGTTSIQTFLSENRNILLNKNILYPLSSRTKKYPDAHHNLASELIKEKRSYLPNEMYEINAGKWKDVVKEIEEFKGTKVIISSEHFNRLTFEEIRMIRKYLANYVIKIIVFLRKQDEYFQSYYCQDVKIGHYWGDIKKYIARYKNEGDYYKKLEPWKQIFGQENIIVRVFNKDFQKELIDQFLAIINFKMGKLKDKKRKTKNITPSFKVIKVINFLNVIARGKLKLSKKNCRVLYLNSLLNSENKIRKVIERVPNSLLENQLLSENEKKELLQEFQQSNYQVAQEYLQQVNSLF
ncbi:hypothetical protein [Crocosphaera sp. Alani8]|uniref:hypothetical protein n=1 Tax=Crocosphaera sp. Alani8 TaxID=3038952 RepID=UPI00313AE5D3